MVSGSGPLSATQPRVAGAARAREGVAARLAVLARSPYSTVMIAFAVWRALLYLGAYIANVVVSANKQFQFALPLSSAGEFLFGSWVHWDAAWYMKIIQHGYSYAGPTVQSNVAFFPLYPAIVRVAAGLLGISSANTPALSALGVLVANASAGAAALVLYRLACTEYALLGLPDARRLAVSASICFLFFPSSIFFASVYPEALFCLLMLVCFLCLRKRRLLLAGFVAGLAGLCRPYGVLLAVPIAVVGIREWHGSPLKAIAALGLCVAGPAAYALFLHLQFGDALAFLRVQGAAGWRGSESMVPFLTAAGNCISLLLHPGNVTRFLEVAYVVVAAGLVVVSFKVLPLEYSLYGAAAWAAPLLSNTVSYQRHVLAVLPIFLVLGLAERLPRGHDLLLATFALLLGVNAILWVNGFWVG